MLPLKTFLTSATLLYVVSAASTLFEKGTIVAFDVTTESLNIIRNGSVLVEDDRITAVVSGLYNGTLPNDTDIIDVKGDIVSTGMVDTHRHLWQSAYKTIASNISLVEYMFRMSPVSQARDIFSPEDIYIGEKVGIYEALNGGTTTIVDHAHAQWSTNHSDAALQAAVDSGGRVYWSYAFVDYADLGEGTLSFEEQVALYRRHEARNIQRGSPTSLAIAYDSFYPGNMEQTRAVLELATEYNVSLISAHSGLQLWGFDSLPKDVHSFGFLNQSIPVIFAHASHLSATDASLLRQYNHYVSITPESEMHFGHDHPDSHLIQDQSSLGVDAAWTFSGDILTQARLWLQVTRRTLYREIINRWHVPTTNPMSVNQAFLLATRNGGLALRRPDIGILAVGAKADLVVWSGTSPSMLGWDDPVAAIILHASVGDVKHVMVDGIIKKRDYMIVDEGYEKLKQRFLISARKIQTFFKELPATVYDEVHFNGFSYGKTLQTDVFRGEGTGYGSQLTS
ncbi:Metallo-dependent hydrolase [Corynespora cassiicola Philippines]|uniref:Metallo-dependent hydrolase n=1 Tax=Corynespora cassiicola Philippines TaxID=1448308 RepID=A0A2T2PD32_CORCC|nr:Metallo-dependent hydrolase [Corynespora cassiicola Philippines]